MNVDNLNVNRYLLFSLMGLIEIVPACYVYFAGDLLGRVRPTAFAMILCAIFSICCSLVVRPWLILLLAVLTKLFITLSFDMIWILASEVYPTVIRISGSGFNSFAANVVDLLTPFIVYHEDPALKHLPMIVFGLICIFAGLL